MTVFNSTAIEQEEPDEHEEKAERGWWENTLGPHLTYVGRAAVLSAGAVSLMQLIAMALIGGTFPKNIDDRPEYSQLLGPVLLIAINTIALARARRYPIPFFAVSVVSMVLLTLLFGDRAAAVTPLYWISILLLSIRTQGRTFIIAAALGLTADIAVSIQLRVVDSNLPLSFDTFGDSAVPPIMNVLMGYGLVIALGKVVQNQRRHKLVDGVRIRRLKQERDTAVEKAVADERTRMARELHDVSAHHLTAVIIQGKAAAEVFETAPEEVQSLLFGVVDEGERALRSLRQLVEVLRLGPTELQSPQPTIHSVLSLVDGCHRSGITVMTDIGKDLAGVDSAIQVSCYRIVQESLSNALRHAHGCCVTVLIKRDSGALRILVENGVGESLDRSIRGQGLGLIGLKERTESLGGSFTAGLSEKGSWKVQAKIPLEGFAG